MTLICTYFSYVFLWLTDLSWCGTKYYVQVRLVKISLRTVSTSWMFRASTFQRILSMKTLSMKTLTVFNRSPTQCKYRWVFHLFFCTEYATLDDISISLLSGVQRERVGVASNASHLSPHAADRSQRQKTRLRGLFYTYAQDSNTQYKIGHFFTLIGLLKVCKRIYKRCLKTSHLHLQSNKILCFS